MAYIFDGVIAGICLICVLIGVQRGFIRSVVHFLGSVIAACLASVLGGALAQWLFDSFFREAMTQKLSGTLQTLGGQSLATALEQALASMPDFLARAMRDAGVTASSISGSISGQTDKAAEMITDYMAPVFVNFLKVLAVIVLFFLFMTLVRMLAAMVGKMLRLPIIGQLDGLLGGLFGFLLALVSVWIIVAALSVFKPMLDASTQAQVDTALSKSIIAGVFVNANPLAGLFS